MKHLLRNLLDHKLAVLAIVLLLFAQAFCELSLPNYTADIVDVGIAQYGVDGTYFERMSRETYDNLTLFMTKSRVFSRTVIGRTAREIIRSEIWTRRRWMRWRMR